MHINGISYSVSLSCEKKHAQRNIKEVKTKMIKTLLFIIACVVFTGCASYPRELVRQRYGCEISNNRLYDTTLANNKPKLKTAYPHGDNKLLRVMQSLEGGVLVSAEMDFWEKENLKSGNLPEKKLNIYVETTDSYVDDEYLLPGLYEYIGVYIYTTTQNARASVRKYKKLPVQIE